MTTKAQIKLPNQTSKAQAYEPELHKIKLNDRLNEEQ